MKILAIETSCDETAIAILETRTQNLESRKKSSKSVEFLILSNQVSSQVKIHRPFGGVVPNLAKREHIKNLPIILKRALKEAKIKKPDAVAVTSGPGLEPALWTGINFAIELSKNWKVPLIAVNHLEGHIYSALMSNGQFLISNKNLFPLLTLIVSGGHTELVFTKKHLEHKILGETLDDAAGEAFDKVARMLKLSYPGGPEISKLAARHELNNSKTPTLILPLLKGEEKRKFPLPPYEGGRACLAGGVRGLFPRPIINSKDLNFSFSGLKTSVLYYLRDNPKADKALIAYEFQQAVVDVLVKKMLDAVRIYKPKNVALGGGVAANDRLRSELRKAIQKNFPLTTFHLPPKEFTGDNAAMIAVAAYFKVRAKKFARPASLKAAGNLRLA